MVEIVGIPTDLFDGKKYKPGELALRFKEVTNNFQEIEETWPDSLIVVFGINFRKIILEIRNYSIDVEKVLNLISKRIDSLLCPDFLEEDDRNDNFYHEIDDMYLMEALKWVELYKSILKYDDVVCELERIVESC